MEINQELLDQIAELEVEALIDGLHDPELRRTPTFLEKVRRFLRDNKLETTPELAVAVKQETHEIPVFDPPTLMEEHYGEH
jgi:hypothetical protein